MKENIKVHGQLRGYLSWPLLLSLFMICANIAAGCVSHIGGLIMLLSRSVICIAMWIFFYSKKRILAAWWIFRQNMHGFRSSCLRDWPCLTRWPMKTAGLSGPTMNFRQSQPWKRENGRTCFPCFRKPQRMIWQRMRTRSRSTRCLVSAGSAWKSSRSM